MIHVKVTNLVFEFYLRFSNNQTEMKMKHTHNINKLIKTILFFLIVFIFITVSSCEQRGSEFSLFDDTPLEELAAAANHQDIELMNELGKKINNIDYCEKKYGKTLLMLCVDNYRIRSVEQLLKMGANPNLKASYYDESAFMSACNYLSTLKNCDLDMVKLLYKYGGDVNKCQIDTNNSNWIYESPLMLSIPAYPEDCMELSKYLIKKGANIDTTLGKPNNCAVNYAVMMSQYELACYLLIDKKAKIPAYFVTLNEGEKNEKNYSLYEFLTTFEDEMITDYPECQRHRERLIKFLEKVAEK